MSEEIIKILDALADKFGIVLYNMCSTCCNRNNNINDTNI